ncbi:MAG TPA: energy-coupling factor transporter transmembrane component T [Anaerolineales bacterium]
MAEAFSLYTGQESLIHKLHPLTKLTLAAFMLVGSLALPGPWPTYILFIAVLVPLALLARVLPRLLSLAWRVVLPFAISVFLIQGFLWPGGTPLVAIGPLSLKREGLLFAVTSVGRILMVVTSFLWFALTTRPDLLMTSLVQRGLPSNLAYIIVATIQIIPRFQQRASTILDAQRARGLETGGNLLQRAHGVLPLVVPLILSSLVDVEERALAVEARAFSHPGKKTSFIEIAESGWEPLLRWVVIIAIAALIGLSIWLRTL